LKVFQELQRFWIDVKIGIYEGNPLDKVFEVEPELITQGVREYLNRARLEVEKSESILLVDWSKIV
jgi:hypothetical protein